MTSYQFKILGALVSVAIGLLLVMILPLMWWAIIGAFATAYGLCWLIERALRRVWSR